MIYHPGNIDFGSDSVLVIPTNESSDLYRKLNIFLNLPKKKITKNERHNRIVSLSKAKGGTTKKRERELG